MSLREAVDDAIEWAIKEDLLDGFFRIQKEEILANSLTEFDEEEFIRDIHQEGYDEGSFQKASDAARNLLAMNLGTHEQIAHAVGLPLEKVKELAQVNAGEGSRK